MARGQRVDIGGLVYHVINRANGRLTIFESAEQYRDFEYLLNEAREQYGMRILAYIIMPNHWHLLLYPQKDGDLSRCMQWLGNAHTRRFHTQTKTIGTGHLYQGRYKSFLVQDDKHLLTVLRYIERNPVRAQLSQYAEDWQWSSAYRRINGTSKERELLGETPTPLPQDYREWLNQPDNEETLLAIRHSTSKGVPYGGESWRERMVEEFGLEQTTRTVGRPKKY